jgi:uncharacterized membrane protein
MPEDKKKGEKKHPKPDEVSIEISPKDTPEDVREKIAIAFAEFSGPLPPPKFLADYGKINETFPERIVKMAEREMRHRHSQQKKQIEIMAYSTKTERLEILFGQIFGFLIGIVALLVCAYTSLKGQPIVGGGIGLLGIGSIISAFIIGRKQKEEREITEDEKEK